MSWQKDQQRRECQEVRAMAEGKWIHGLGPDMGLADAARKVLALRLEVVRKFLPLAMLHAHEDPENVHQLRVGTRRADAGLRIFRGCFPGRVYRAARQRLRSIRRAAGAARDWDVFLEALRQRNQEVPAGQQHGVDFLIGYSLGQRQAAQTTLTTIESDQESSFREFAEETLEAIRPPHEDRDGRLADLARVTLTSLVEKLQQAAQGNLKDYEQLHQVRILGKRVRYAMEVLSECFPRELAEVLYPRIEEMQEILGRANDSHVASQRLLGLREQMKAWPETWARIQEGLESLLQFHQRRLPQERRRFVKWLEQWRQLGAERVLRGE